MHEHCEQSWATGRQQAGVPTKGKTHRASPSNLGVPQETGLRLSEEGCRGP